MIEIQLDYLPEKKLMTGIKLMTKTRFVLNENKFIFTDMSK